MTVCDNLIRFLNDYRIKDENVKPTHQSWGSLIQGKFLIDKANIKDFLQLYSLKNFSFLSNRTKQKI